jgi:hypothetical protein
MKVLVLCTKNPIIFIEVLDELGRFIKKITTSRPGGELIVQRPWEQILLGSFHTLLR